MSAARWPAAAAVPLAFWLASGTAHADLWAYVDPQGRSHFADHPVDARYKLFFKGETTPASTPASFRRRAPSA